MQKGNAGFCADDQGKWAPAKGCSGPEYTEDYTAVTKEPDLKCGQWDFGWNGGVTIHKSVTDDLTALKDKMVKEKGKENFIMAFTQDWLDPKGWALKKPFHKYMAVIANSPGADVAEGVPYAETANCEACKKTVKESGGACTADDGTKVVIQHKSADDGFSDGAFSFDRSKLKSDDFTMARNSEEDTARARVEWDIADDGEGAKGDGRPITFLEKLKKVGCTQDNCALTFAGIMTSRCVAKSLVHAKKLGFCVNIAKQCTQDEDAPTLDADKGRARILKVLADPSKEFGGVQQVESL